MDKEYKRTSRIVRPEVRQKISNSLKNKPKADVIKNKISAGLKRYWSDDSNFPADQERHEGTGRGYIETGDIV